MSHGRDVAPLALFDTEGRIVLQHRDTHAKRLPDHWGFFGGGMDAGETPLEAMRREIMEELEYSPIDPKPLITFAYERTNPDGSLDAGTVHVFVEKYDDAQPLVQHEGQGLGWFKPEETQALLMTENGRRAVAAIDGHLAHIHTSNP